MRRRVRKKIAKRYLTAPKGSYLPYGAREEEYRGYSDGRPAVIKTIAIFPRPVERLIWKMAMEAGWDGCHWDDPLLISVDDTNLRKYEEQYDQLRRW